MQNSNPSSSSPPSPPLLDTAPFLPRSRRRAPPSLRTAATFFRRASGRRMMLREPSVRVREAAAAEVEGRQSEWAYSRPVVALDVAWNAAFLAIGASVLALSADEDPCVPLRAWIVGYLLQGALHSLCVVAEFTRRRRTTISGTHSGSNVEWSFSSESDEEFYPSEQFLEGDGNSITKHIESANTMLSFIWWIVGFYWVTAGGQSLTRDSPQLYWLCITFLSFDVMIVLICVAVACLIGIAVCCCLPCILAILYVVADQECCICLSAYDDGAELRELPCNHHFHCTCIDKWLLINATCPLCKFNILRTGNHHQEV